jgi:hypothetical protein
MSDRCPVCLGQVYSVPDIGPHDKHKLVVKRRVIVTCPGCHGSGIRPSWFDDPRNFGVRSDSFDYTASQ